MAKTKQFPETAQSSYGGAIRPTGKRIADWQPSRASTGGEIPSSALPERAGATKNSLRSSSIERRPRFLFAVVRQLIARRIDAPRMKLDL